MDSKERKLRVIARGEHSNHSHVVVGEAKVTEKDGVTFITVEKDGDATLRHILESEWLKGNEVWTKEHHDIELEAGTYEYVQQSEYDPYEDKIRQVRD
jgi:hypothetical protein